MSDRLASLDPFALEVLDEATELRALARALSFAEGFTLLFVRCNQPLQRQRLTVTLRTELPQLTVKEIHFDEPIPHLLDALRERITSPPPDAVFVSGLEYSLPTAADAHASPFVANLNAARNSFSLVIPCPLVLWVPQYVLTAIVRGAPDFFSIRSGMYSFAATPQETIPFAEALTAGYEWATANLTLSEKQERIVAIKSLLDDYQSLPATQRDRHTEARLLTRLGTLHETLGQWAEALEVYKQGLEILRQLGDRHGEGLTLSNLGDVYQSQGRWDETLAAYEQSLTIRRELGDRHGEGLTLNNLGSVYQSQGRWDETLAAYEQSLTICRELGDHHSEGQILNNLGIVYRNQGRWAEALAAYERTLTIRRELGDHYGEGLTLVNLALLQEAQGHIVQALEYGRQALTVLQTTEAAAWRAKLRKWIAEWERQINARPVS